MDLKQRLAKNEALINDIDISLMKLQRDYEATNQRLESEFKSQLGALSQESLQLSGENRLLKEQIKEQEKES